SSSAVCAPGPSAERRRPPLARPGRDGGRAPSPPPLHPAPPRRRPAPEGPAPGPEAPARPPALRRRHHVHAGARSIPHSARARAAPLRTPPPSAPPAQPPPAPPPRVTATATAQAVDPGKVTHPGKPAPPPGVHKAPFRGKPKPPEGTIVVPEPDEDAVPPA